MERGRIVFWGIFTTKWLNGSGGTGEAFSQLCIISGKTRLRASDEAAVRLEPVLGHPKSM
jgi:hypothetical protein